MPGYESAVKSLVSINTENISFFFQKHYQATQIHWHLMGGWTAFQLRATDPGPGPRPTNGISIEFEVIPKYEVLWFKVSSIDHNEILHTPRQCNCRDVCKISMWSLEHFLN